MVRMFLRMKAHAAAGSWMGVELRHTTGALPRAARAERMPACGVLGANIEVLVSTGTAAVSFRRRCSYAPNRNVLSLRSGKPSVPPNCCRFDGGCTAVPFRLVEKGTRGGGATANGLRASNTESRKNPYTSPC